MKLMLMFVLALICTTVVWISYLAIKSINYNENLDKKNKNNWVLLVTYLPVIGAFIYYYKKRNNKL